MRCRIGIYFALTTVALSAVASNSGPDNSVLQGDDDATALQAQGAMRVGSDNAIVPDASSEHPLIQPHPEDQPLCEPASSIKASAAFRVMDGYTAKVLTRDVANPRKIVLDTANHLLAVSGGQAVYSIRMDKCGNSESVPILTSHQLDGPIEFGLALYDGHLYVGTADAIWQYPYVDGQHSPLGEGTRVVHNIKGTRPDVAIDPFGHAYIPRTTANGDVNTEAASRDAVIKRFNFRAVPSDGYDFETDGEIYAYGTNVQGAMAFDAQARLWGIDAPFEAFRRADLGGDIAPVGLAEEVNLYEFPYKNYGYPYCFTEFDLSPFTESAKGKGAQWAHPVFMNDSVNMDSYCQQEENNRRPAVPLVPESHASSIYFYMGTFCSVGDMDTMGTSVGMPCNWTDTPIVAYHNTNRVVHLPFDDLGHVPRWDKQEEVIFEAQSDIAPVGLAVDAFGRLVVSSDNTNEIFMIQRIYDENAHKALTDKYDAHERAQEAKEEAKERALAEEQGVDVDDLP